MGGGKGEGGSESERGGERGGGERRQVSGGGGRQERGGGRRQVNARVKGMTGVHTNGFAGGRPGGAPAANAKSDKQRLNKWFQHIEV